MSTILEELVALIGFKVDGLNKVEDAKRKLGSFSDFLNRRLSGLRFDLITKGFDKLGVQMSSGFSNAASRLTSLAGTLFRIGSLVTGVASAFAAAAVAAFGLSIAIVKVQSNAARLRRQQMMDAKDKGTRAGNIDKLSNIFGYIGVEDGAASANQSIGSVNDKVQEARKGPGDARSWFRQNRIATDRQGRARDSSEITIDVIKGYLDAKSKRDEARSRADADPNSKKKERDYRAAERAFEKFKEGMPTLGDALRQNLDQIKNWEEFRRNAIEAGRLNPPKSEEDDKKNEEFFKQSNELMFKLSSILQVFLPGVETLATKVVGPLNEFADKIIATLKAWGLMPRTKEEVVEGQKTIKKFESAEDVQSMLRTADQIVGNKAATESADLYERQLRKRIELMRQAYDKESQGGNVSVATKIFEALKATIEELKTYEQKKAPLDAGDVRNWLKEAIESAKPQPSAADAIGPKTEINYDNSGNDQRKFSNSISVTVASAQQVAAEVRQQLAAANAKIGPTAAKLGSTTGAPAAV